MTGPAPLGGGRKSCPLETQAVPLSGAKSGGPFAADAGKDAKHAAAQAMNDDTVRPRMFLRIAILQDGRFQ